MCAWSGESATLAVHKPIFILVYGIRWLAAQRTFGDDGGKTSWKSNFSVDLNEIFETQKEEEKKNYAGKTKLDVEILQDYESKMLFHPFSCMFTLSKMTRRNSNGILKFLILASDLWHLSYQLLMMKMLSPSILGHHQPSSPHIIYTCGPNSYE